MSQASVRIPKKEKIIIHFGPTAAARVTNLKWAIELRESCLTLENFGSQSNLMSPHSNKPKDPRFVAPLPNQSSPIWKRVSLNGERYYFVMKPKEVILVSANTRLINYDNPCVAERDGRSQDSSFSPGRKPQ